ncbi:hypothetical protein [Mesorhizobium ciceri]|uniref:hypothetical protein n=1 Tax=Mesorhizobium ciceri TaxID=39645 RepID=UPI000A6313BA
MAATKPPPGRFERQAKADETRQSAGIVEPTLEIDGRVAQAGQPGGILHGAYPVANESPRRSFGYGIVRRNTKNLPS